MERGGRARCSARGGDDVPAPGPSRTRVATGAGSLLVAAALAVVALGGGGEVALAVGARLVLLALLALVAAVVLGWTPLVPVSALLLGAAYATRLQADDVALDTRAPLLAAGLLAAVELGYWSIEARQRVRAERGDDLRRLGVVTVLSFAGLAVSSALLAAADVLRTEGLAVDLLGAAAATGALLLVALSARRRAE